MAFQFEPLKLEMTLLMRLRCLLGRREKPLRLLRDLLEHSGIYILIFDDPGLLRNILMIRLHRPAFTVSFTVENSGSIFGGEVRLLAAGLFEFVFIY